MGSKFITRPNKRKRINKGRERQINRDFQPILWCKSYFLGVGKFFKLAKIEV